MKPYLQLKTMKQLLIILLIFSSIKVSYGQTFIANHNENENIYDWIFRIKKDSTINLIYQINNKAVYGEYNGTVKRLNDTIYHVSAQLITGQNIMKAPYNDSISIQMDSKIASEIDKIAIEYSNGKSIDISKYSIIWSKYNRISISIDKLLYNEKNNTNSIFITINRKNSITNEFLKFQIPYGSAAFFSTGDLIEFQMMIKVNYARIIGEPPMEFVNLKMKKKQ
jgi:hypothetical protein